MADIDDLALLHYKLAGLATVADGSAMDRSDILNAIREVSRKNNLGDIMDSTSLSRLKKLGVTCGAARRERHKGKSRYFINQHRTGTLSRRVLTDMLRMRLERLWTCSSCNDDHLPSK